MTVCQQGDNEARSVRIDGLDEETGWGVRVSEGNELIEIEFDEFPLSWMSDEYCENFSNRMADSIKSEVMWEDRELFIVEDVSKWEAVIEFLKGMKNDRP